MMVDDYSRFPVVEVIRSTPAKVVVPVFDSIYSLFGYPEIVKTDNGYPFNGSIGWST